MKPRLISTGGTLRINTVRPMKFSALMVFAATVGFCACISCSSKKVTDLSDQYPYDQFVGQRVVLLKPGELWKIVGHTYSMERNHIAFPSTSTRSTNSSDRQKVADLPIGTMLEIHSVKYKHFDTEISGHRETLALCKVTLPKDGKVSCAVDWRHLAPEQNLGGERKFELVYPLALPRGR